MSPVELLELPQPETKATRCENQRRLSITLCLVVLALIVRLGFFVYLYGIPFTQPATINDESFTNETTNIASTLATGHGFSSPMISVVDGDPRMGPSAWIAPVYPFFCAIMFRLLQPFSSASFSVILLAQCVVSAVTIIPLMRIARLTTGPTVGYVASFLWAVFPWFSKWAVTWVWEISLTAFLFTWLFWYALRLQKPATSWVWIGFGALWGLGLLVNPSMMTLLPVSAAWIAWCGMKQGQSWVKNGLLSATVCLAVIGPWLIRNRMVFGEWVFLRDNFGFEFALGNFHGSNGRGWAPYHPTKNPEELKAYASMGELDYIKSKTELGEQFVRDYPGEFLELTSKRVLWFWDGSAINYTDGIPGYWMPLSYGVFSILLMPSMLWAFFKRLAGWPLFLGAILLYPLPYYLTYSQLRYRHAIEPLMLLLVVWAVSDTISRFRAKPAAS